MRLLEYQGKELFSEYGISIPPSLLAVDESQAYEAAKKIGFPLMIKSQLTVGGRGKGGAVLKCNNILELKTKFSELLHKKVNGELPRGVLVEGMVNIVKELYISFFLNRTKRCYSLICASEGGMNIESVENKIIVDISIDGLANDTAESVANRLKLEEAGTLSLIDLLVKLSKLVDEKEAELAEINPVAITSEGTCLALDSKVIIDDNSMFRHPELRKYQNISELQAEAEKSGFSLVDLDGDVAIIGNGAGLVMSTLDIVNDYGGKPGAFLDFGGQATTETIYKALEVISKLPRIKSILVNLFGGIVRTDLVAQAIINSYNNELISVPIYARISGAESEKAKKMLFETNAKIYETVEDAISSLVTDLEV